MYQTFLIVSIHLFDVTNGDTYGLDINGEKSNFDSRTDGVFNDMSRIGSYNSDSSKNVVKGRCHKN